ncbi:S10 family peptidase [Sulfuriroseicoccus oceanibius]|uniref:Uncharacterized protein n=1 Tax=Sulfuriroseicoccus oceanibius TaxID=2707525 RepID=A0A6B3L8V9_9BACT|nr:peptidase S10 [Sulfuriroseicoccus oceanibius]QQL43904.1 hypothetical protein G3M56_008340 [Sulfuriroseicoccus oceanibius]
MLRSLLILGFSLCLSPFATAQEADSARPADAPTRPAEKDSAKIDEITPVAAEIEQRATSQNTIQLAAGSPPLSYTVESAMMPMTDDTGKELARIFHTYYHAKTEDNAARPLVFCFNGGPGASSVWLHLGGIGPFRANTPDLGTGTSAAPFELVANPHTLLRTADLVFVDPVSTGFSRGTDKKSAAGFHGFRQDISGNAAFIRRFIAHHKLWNRPIFLLGESYGVIRVSALAGKLSNEYGLRTNGLILVSGLLDFQTLRSTATNDLPYATFLPTYARTAIYHGVLKPENPETLVEQARRFAESEYVQALHAGRSIDPATRQHITAELARFTGLPVDWIDRADLRIDPSVFRGLLLREKRQQIGRFDGRVTAPSPDPISPYASGDPSFDVLSDAYSTLIHQYLTVTLGFEPNDHQHYRTLTSKVHPWSYAPYENRFTEVIDSLNSTLQTNPKMRIFVAAGNYDLATPYEGIEHSLRRLRAPNDSTITHALYEGGHMMYSNPQALEKLGKSLRKFVTESLAQP